MDKAKQDSLSEFWDGKMNLPTIKTKHDSLYEPMSSEISAGVFKPHRDSCSQCGTSFMSHFFVTCICNLSYCCACLSLNDYCMDCHQFLGAGSTFTKTPMFAKHIGGHNCYLQKEDQTIKYSPGLKGSFIQQQSLQIQRMFFITNPFYGTKIRQWKLQLCISKNTQDLGLTWVQTNHFLRWFIPGTVSKKIQNSSQEKREPHQ